MQARESREASMPGSDYDNSTEFKIGSNIIKGPW